MRAVQGGKLAFATAMLATIALCGSAIAAETSRTEYVERVEPICKTNVLANKRIFKGAKEEVRAGELKKASRHFTRAATAFGKTIGQVAAAPQPTADEVKLAKWLDTLREVKDVIKQIGRALALEKRNKAESYSVELNRTSRKANNTVLGFGFDYCLIDSSRFG